MADGVVPRSDGTFCETSLSTLLQEVSTSHLALAQILFWFYQPGIPESLRQESETIMHKEVDQSLQDLSDNLDTDKALQTISVHMQKAADNVHKIPELGSRVGTIIIGMLT